jgi:hypothetical protein
MLGSIMVLRSRITLTAPERNIIRLIIPHPPTATKRRPALLSRSSNDRIETLRQIRQNPRFYL